MSGFVAGRMPTDATLRLARTPGGAEFDYLFRLSHVASHGKSQPPGADLPGANWGRCRAGDGQGGAESRRVLRVAAPRPSGKNAEARPLPDAAVDGGDALAANTLGLILKE